MRSTSIVLTGTGMLSLGMIVTALAMTGGMPNVNAMALLDPISQIHDAGHGQMHGGGHHQPMHPECDGNVDMDMAAHHETMAHGTDCPRGSGPRGTVGRMMHGMSGHMQQGQSDHAECLMIGSND